MNKQEILESELTPEEELEISGYRPEQAALIDREFLIQQDAEPSESSETSENPLIRGAIAALLVGGVMGFGWMLWSLLFAAKPIAKPQVTPTQVLPSIAEGESDETSRLKAELALRNQASRTANQSQKQSPPSPQRSIISQPSSTTRSISPPSPRIIRQTITSPPRIIRERVPIPTLQPKIVATPKSVKSVDPIVRWHELATLGQQTTVVSNHLMTENQPLEQQTLPDELKPNRKNFNQVAANSSAITFTSEAGSGNRKTAAISPVAIATDESQQTTDREQMQTPGEWGILNRTRYDSQNNGFAVTSSPRRVPIGTTAAGKMLLPIIWTESDKNQGRYAVELQQDVLSTDKRVVLQKGTILITEVDSVSKVHNIVKQSVVAIVYSDTVGQIRQKIIPKDTIIIQGENNRPLIAKSIEDKGAAIAQQDILIGLLGAAVRSGEIFNQTQTLSSTIISHGEFNSQTISNQATKPNVLAAALEGFFKPISQRLTQRANRESQEILNSPNVAIVPTGTKVSILFNTFFEADS
ncbi:hypothetical protein HCG51_11480 [Tolypothrix sp. PCC 7910]|uniref:TrbI/VirB10 family protein n=1 Tax=Tolypothrix sp. PCC 7910 TaxID=2099387 RepID=UPI001427836F|nr:TrbI/VirB10 family protein [Tolypothrix sp. PCC 7910]QIR37272.1 hypothetical protein HCG51_11480 [Tolypothrix sp. PCC 7910]